MASFIDIVAGKIAVAMKLLDNDQMEAALKEQQTGSGGKTLLEILLSKKMLRPEQLDGILAKAREEQQRYDFRFGKLAVGMNFVTEENLQKAHEVQEKQNPDMALRTVLVDSGTMTAQQAQLVQEALKGAHTLVCPMCKRSSTFAAQQEGKSYKCIDCKNVELVAPEKPNADTSAGIDSSDKAKPELVLSGVAKGLEMQLPYEEEDEMTGKRIQDYMILTKLGAGAMGVVYKAEQIKLRRIVALKMLSQKYSADSFYVNRFLVEARSAAKLNHPNILQVYDVDSFEGGFFFSMEYIQGESVNSILWRMKKLPFDKALDITIQITQALVELHEHGIVHRDIKPDNIMLTTKGVAKLADLGLAKSAGQGEDKEKIMGTPFYMAPEQITAPQSVDSRSDMYSLGACLYRMATGVTPFLHSDPRTVLQKVLKQSLPSASSVCETVPHSLSWIIDKMTQKKPEDRYSQPGELLEVLNGLRDQLSGQAALAVASAVPKLAAHGGLKIEVSRPIDTSNLLFDEEHSKPASVQHPSSEASGSAPVVEPSPAPEKRLQTVRRTLGEVNKATAASQKDGTRKAEAPRASQASKAQAKPKPPVKALAIGGVGLVFAIIVFRLLFSSPPPPVEKGGPTPEEIRAQKYQALEERLKSQMEEQNPAKINAVFAQTKAFVTSFPGSSEAQQVEDYELKLRARIVQLETEKRQQEMDKHFQGLEKNSNASLERGNFIEALQALSSESYKGYSEEESREMEERVESLRAAVRQRAEEHCRRLLEGALQCKRNLDFQGAIDKMGEACAQGQRSQFPENLEQFQKFRQECESLLGEIKGEQYRATIQSKFESFISTGNFPQAKAVLQQYATPASIKAFISQVPNAAKQEQKLNADFIKLRSDSAAELKQLEYWDEMGPIIDAFAQNQKKVKDILREVELVFTSADGKSLQGTIIAIRKDNITIQSTRGGSVGRKISSLTWDCKKKILEILISRNAFEFDDAGKYHLALLSLYTSARIPEMPEDLSEQRRTRLRERIATWILNRLQRIGSQDDVAEAEILLADRVRYYDTQSWRLLNSLVAGKMLQACEQSLLSSSKQKIRGLIVEYFHDYLFDLPGDAGSDLESGRGGKALRDAFGERGCALSEKIDMAASGEKAWTLSDSGNAREYRVVFIDGALRVFTPDWSSYYQEALGKEN